MEVYMQNVAFSATNGQIKAAVAQAIHTPEYNHHSSMPLNFSTSIFPRRFGTSARGRCGKLTFPFEAVGEQFLREYGEPTPARTVVVGTRIKFSKSKYNPRPDTVDEIRRLPFRDPKEEEEEKTRSLQARSRIISVDEIQFGWHCRDQSFSIEWEQLCRSYGKVFYDNDRREFRIQLFGVEDTRIVAIRVADVHWAGAGVDNTQRTVIILNLTNPPSFETSPPVELGRLLAGLRLESHPSPSKSGPLRQRWPAIDPTHAEVAPYVSHMVRVVCSGTADLDQFRWLCKSAHLHAEDSVLPAVHRGLFSESSRRLYSAWLQGLRWKVAFQVESLTRKRLLDLNEVLSLRGDIRRMIVERGATFTSTFLQHFITQMKTKFSADDSQGPSQPVEQFFKQCVREYTPPSPRIRNRRPLMEWETFQCLHVAVTPTTIILDGPYPERLNRVIRWYPWNHDSFLRVSFVDEAHLQYRFDRDVDGRDFIKRRVGNILTNGLVIAGRHFQFLAYSQSALKEHAVWFVREFSDVDGTTVNAASIIKRIGNFDKLAYDPKLIYCPARYGARISQSFTTTDSSVAVEAEEVFTLDDIKDDTGRWTFTDGVGTISPELAQAIWVELRKRGRRARRAPSYPRAYQIRFMGSKGMLSVDHNLSGRAICVRPSMIKFDAPNSREIEIARAFDKPGPFYLNRPLIMILEDLGVECKVFRDLQDAAVSEARQSVNSLAQAAKLLETYGLGASYRLSSVLSGLAKLGIDTDSQDEFWEQMMEFAVNHVLRELKHHARIPVKGAWNLVGVADIHGYLKEGEVFIHIVPNDGSASTYLNGPVMVTRSPSIHPGDVQVVHAIGRPPHGSPFEKETLRNCIVFSTKGNRPLASYLGGGDLDGDLFCCTPLESLRPKKTYPPAEYRPAERVLLNRPSTMQDVADFVTEYINSDSLGIIASTWLVIADQSEHGIFDPDCLTLSDLHSDAVDYPKSGRPVTLDKIPRLKSRAKPDWNAPETTKLDPNKYYQSRRAIGHLFRAIDLPALRTADRAQRTQRTQLQMDGLMTFDDILHDFYGDQGYNAVAKVVRRHISRFISLRRQDEQLIAEIWELAEIYRSHLQTICADHTLSRSRDAILTEEEAVVGTIVAKCSQARKRKNLMTNLREHTASLVQGVEHQLAGEMGTLPERSLARAWVAYRVSLLCANQFGAKSFGWMALREIFDAIKIIQSDNEGYFN